MMKSCVMLVVLGVLALFTLSTASVVSQIQSDVVGKCDPRAFFKLASDALTDVTAFCNTVALSYESLAKDAIECFEHNSNFTTLVACEADALTNWVQRVGGAIEIFSVNVIALSEELVDDLANCK